jgi:eukaryotic-like serine/threonine-protein kinase
MEYLHGNSLAQLIRQRWPLGLQHRLRIVVQLCQALAYAHEQSVVHRDVKPANILIMRDGTIKVLDFGLGARAQISGPKANRWSGTIPYMSPEQVNGTDIDGRSDIWSAGITMFELVTGKLPFTGDTNSVFDQIVNAPVPEIPETIPLSHELNQILHRALYKSRENRFSSGHLFVAELQRLMPAAESRPWIPPPIEASATDGITRATIGVFSLTPEQAQLPNPTYNIRPSAAHGGIETQPVDQALYSQLNLGFTHKPNGEVVISSGRFSLIAA